MKHRYLSLPAVLALGMLFGYSVNAQDALDPLGSSEPVTDQEAIQSLESLQRALAISEEELASLRDELRAAPDPVTRDRLTQKLTDLEADIEQQRRQFEGFAVAIDLTPFFKVEKEKFDWQQEVGKLLEPIMAEVKSATAESRIIGELRAQIEEVGNKRDLAEKAVANLEALLQQPASSNLTARLNSRLNTWRRTYEQADSEYTALDIQLQSRLAAREPMVEQTTKYFRHFFATRGLNLVLGALAFALVFFGFRFAEYLLRKIRKGEDKKSFGSRLTALLFHVFSILGGLVAMLLVFNLVGDWFMLGIIVIFLLGVGWAGINTLPQHVETVKLMLNIGAVREGQRLDMDGTPYRVDALGFAARLVNPSLDGGVIQIPVKMLVGMHSRAVGEKEPWFPCEEGDWVELDDGVTGRVVSQTPSSVQLVQLGGARVAYPTPEFLSHSPRNLSTNFRIEQTFGVDYKHQADATRDIPAKMQAKLEAELAEIAGEENILDVSVLFSSAGPSSLDYTVAVDVRGEAASQARELKFAVQRILVDACNENGWEIPFTQITMHQA